jgi:hypothetical protein
MNGISELERRVLKELRSKRFSEEEVKAFLNQVRNPQSHKKQKHRHFDQKSRHIKFAVVGDTHIGSEFHDNEALHKFYDIAIADGVKTFYQVGDILDGENMWRGHVYQLVAHGADGQVELATNIYPRRKGVVTHFITGNHDTSFFKNAGVNVGKLLSERRDDLRFLGDRDVDVLLNGKTRMKLLHPGGGSAYALSYRPQKIVESFEGGKKPQLLFIGHYHKIENLFYRNVNVFQAGTFESQTDFMAEKGISAHKGGWILDLETTVDGTIKTLQTRLVPFYE